MDDQTAQRELVTRKTTSLRELPDPPTLSDQPAFMSVGVQAMDIILTLGKVAVRAPRPNGRGYTRRHAPLVGLAVRLVKLYEGYLSQLVEHRRELAIVFQRPFYESHIKLQYLIRTGRASARSFLHTSFRPEKEILTYLNGIKRKRRLIPIENRIRNSIIRNIRRVGLSQRALLSTRQWELDGKNMRTMLEFLNKDLHYSFVFGISSHATHGSWYDLWLHHLHHDEKGYHPDVTYGSPDPKYIGPISVMLCEGMSDYLRYFHLDSDRSIRAALKLAEEYVRRLDYEWERRAISEASVATA
jgi:hypothetical protein